jgi:hypothetical protein
MPRPEYKWRNDPGCDPKRNAHTVRLAAKILSGRKGLQIRQDIAACRDLSEGGGMIRAAILNELHTRFALRRKSFPADRTYFDDSARTLR